MPKLSVIIPTLNEADVIGRTLVALAPIRSRGHEVLVVDGGSCDATLSAVGGFADQVLSAPAGRARQMNAGAAAATGHVLWFVHADTRVPADADQRIGHAVKSGALWGHFDVQLAGRQLLLRLVERMMNLRSRITGVATGDQGMFVRRDVFEQLGGFPDIDLMEDISLSRSLKRLARPCSIRCTVVTSSRRWENHGVLRTIVLMWRLRLAYALGADPAVLARRYRASD
jgi:rSAM/selenodomain-associated transferase 2